MNLKDRRLAVRVEDHPLEYTAFSGGIPDENQGSRIVELWDRSFFSLCGADQGSCGGQIGFLLYRNPMEGRIDPGESASK